MPQVVVAICTYNNAAMLDRTLATLETQTVDRDVQWSVLIVDNNCTDDTAAVVDRCIRRGLIPGLRRAVEPVQGLAYARRRAVIETEAELIAFVDDDCLLAPDWVNELMRFAAPRDLLGALGGRVTLAWEAEPSELARACALQLAQQEYGDQPVEITRDGMAYLVGAGLVVSREALIQSGWLDRMLLVDRQGKRLSSGGDTEMVFRIRNAGYKLWYNPAMRIQHCVPAQRMTEEYLLRLTRAITRNALLIRLIGGAPRPRLTAQLAFLVRQVVGLSLLAVQMAGGRLGGDQRQRWRQKLEWHRRLGNIEGFSLLLKPRLLRDALSSSIPSGSSPGRSAAQQRLLAEHQV